MGRKHLGRISECKVYLKSTQPIGSTEIYRTSLPVEQSYISTPLKSRGAYTDTQCLYKTAIKQLPQMA